MERCRYSLEDKGKGISVGTERSTSIAWAPNLSPVSCLLTAAGGETIALHHLSQVVSIAHSIGRDICHPLCLGASLTLVRVRVVEKRGCVHSRYFPRPSMAQQKRSRQHMPVLPWLFQPQRHPAERPAMPHGESTSSSHRARHACTARGDSQASHCVKVDLPL